MQNENNLSVMMKKLKRTILAITLLLAVVAVVCVAVDKATPDSAYESDKLSSAEVAMLCNGDIILRKGFGFVSNKIVEILNEPYSLSHCGIVVLDDGAPYVIHSVSSTLSDYDGVQRSSLNSFFADSKPCSIVVVRYLGAETDGGTLITTEAKRYLQDKVPFDNSFDLADNTKMYCTELVWKILLDKYSCDIYPDQSSHAALGFAPFMDTTRFKVIINHCVFDSSRMER